MKILRTFVPNSLENYNYLAYCPKTKLAAAVDPFSADHLAALASTQGLTITQIWVTHEHGDHIRDLDSLKQRTSAAVHAPSICQGKFHADHWLENEQAVTLGNSSAVMFHTPGHTPGHGVFYFQGNADDTPFLIAGDTLFNAGVGNVRSGNAEELYQSIKYIRQWIKPNTEIYSGHDYLANNLTFTVHHCPELEAAQELLAKAKATSHDETPVTTWQQELKINLFLRLGTSDINSLTGISADDDNARLQQFKALRALRDQW